MTNLKNDVNDVEYVDAWSQGQAPAGTKSRENREKHISKTWQWTLPPQ